jgi:hypothetical protein
MEEKKYLGDLAVHGRIKLQCWVVSCSSEQTPVAGSREYNKPPGLIRCRDERLSAFPFFILWVI